MSKTSPKFAIGTKVLTTKAILVNGQITRIPAEGVITGVHDFFAARPRKTSWVYHVDVDGLSQPFGEKEIAEILV